VKILRIGDFGEERPAVLGRDGEIRLLPDEFGDVDGNFWELDRQDEIRHLSDRGLLADLAVTRRRLGSPIARPGKIVCIGLNYRDHVFETGGVIPDEPVIFLKASNCVVGPNDRILIPRGSKKTDWEVELGVVIGRRARYLESPDESDSVIAGYCLSNDVSERAFQLEHGSQWDKGKSCESFNPLGPWLLTSDEIPDPQQLALRLSVNGELRQNGTTRDMIFNVHHIVWYVSQFMVLEPGDLINTGTPAGVSLGHDDVPFLSVGDVVVSSIDRLGTQRNIVGQG